MFHLDHVDVFVIECGWLVDGVGSLVCSRCGLAASCTGVVRQIGDEAIVLVEGKWPVCPYFGKRRNE